MDRATATANTGTLGRPSAPARAGVNFPFVRRLWTSLPAALGFMLAYTAAAAPRAPTCDDLRHSGASTLSLWPTNWPRSTAELLAEYERPRAAPLKPVELDGDVRFLRRDYDQRALAIDVAVDGRVRLERRVPFRPRTWATLARLGPLNAFSANGDGMIAAVVGSRSSGVVAFLDSRSWREHSSLPFDLPNDRPGIPSLFVAPGGLQTFGIAAHLPSGSVFFFRATPGRRFTGTPNRLQSSGYIDPHVFWNGSHFAVLAGRGRDFGPHSIGIWELPEGQPPVYQPIFDADDPSSPSAYYVARMPFWAEGAYHIALKKWPPARLFERPTAILLHFTPGRPTLVDTCRTL